MTIQLKNPHSVLAVLETRPQDVLQIVLLKQVLERAYSGTPLPANESRDAWGAVAQIAHQKGIRLIGAAPREKEFVPRERPQRHDRDRDRRGGRSERPDRPERDEEKEKEGGRFGAAEATVREREPLAIEQLFAGAREKRGGHGLWLALDSLQDPHNIGAIFRTAAFFGVQGIVMTQERSAPLSATAYDVASGGVEHVPFCVQVNLKQAFEVAKEAGLWILGTSEHAKDDIAKIERDRPWLLVVGNEERGMRRLTEESCDVLCKISHQGSGVTSLNVSVAAGVFISRLA